jgi:hypothetical protein
MQFVKLGATALAGVFLAFATVSTPAFAQNQGQPASIQVTRDLVGPLNEARAAIIAKDWATATTKLGAATAKIKTPTDRAQVDRLRLAMASETGDHATQIATIDSLVASGTLTADEIKQYKGALIKVYADAGDPAKSLAASRTYVDEYGGSHEMLAAIGNDLVKANDNATAITYIDKAIAAARTAGAKAPESYYRLKARAVNATGDKPGYYKVLEDLLAEYPNDNYWKELILRVQNEPSYGEQARLDMYRALIGAGIKLSPQEASNAGREAIRRGLPQDALSVLEPAFASGELGTAQEDKDNLATAKRRVGEDKPGLAKETADIIAEGDASAMASIGEAHLSYGDNAKAAEVLKAALDKGISNAGEADLARLHLGIAQYRSGDKAAAQATWATIKADNGAAVLAQNWTLISKLK